MSFFDVDRDKEEQDYGVLSYFNDKKNKTSNKNDKKLDEYGLEEWEKEEVKKGNEDIWNFEEEDLEDDDYYSEDEK